MNGRTPANAPSAAAAGGQQGEVARRADDEPALDGAPSTSIGPRPAARRLVAWAAGVVVVLVVLVLAAPGLFASADPPGFYDHPYQLARLESFRQALADGEDPIGWSPDFAGGFPELQFYPPGHAALGAALGAVLGIDDEQAYWLVVVLAYVAPALAGMTALSLLSVRQATATAGGIVVALVPSGWSSTTSAIAIGTVGSRLALAAAVLTVAFVYRSARSAPGRARGWWAVAAGAGVATTVLMHPYRLPVLGAVVVWVLWRSARRGGDVLPASLGCVGGLALSGAWGAGLLLYRDLAVPFLPGGSLSLARVVKPDFGWQGIDWFLVVAGVVASYVVSRRGTRPDGHLRELVESFTIPVVAAMLIVQFVVFGLLGLWWFDPVRVFDDVIFWFALGSVLWIEGLPRRPVADVAAVGAVAVLWVAISHQVLPSEAWSTRIGDLDRGVPGELWARLATEPDGGRVAFTADRYHDLTYVTGLTTVRTGRETINGGSPAPSPVRAMALWGPDVASLDSRAFHLDGQQLLGARWEEVREEQDVAATLARRLAQLGVTRVVAEDRPAGGGTDVSARDALDRWPGLFHLDDEVGDLGLYDVVAATPGLFVPASGDIELVPVDDREVRVDAVGDGAVLVRRLGSPYLQVSLDGTPVDGGRDEFGQVVVPVGRGSHELRVDMRTPGALIAARAACVLAGSVLLAAALLTGVRRRAGRDGPPASPSPARHRPQSAEI